MMPKPSPTKLFFALGAVGALWLAGCISSGSKTKREKPNPYPPGSGYYVYELLAALPAAKSGTLLLENAPYYYCVDDQLIGPVIDTLDQQYEIRGDTLHFWFMEDEDDPDIVLYDVYIRESGTGIKGVWRRLWTEISNPQGGTVGDLLYEILSDNDSLYHNEILSFTEEHLDVIYERNPYWYMWEIIKILPPDVTYQFNGPYVSHFTNSQGLVVSFTENEEQTMIVSSNEPAFAPFIEFAPIPTCPDDGPDRPLWFVDFFDLPPALQKTATRPKHPVRLRPRLGISPK